MLGGPQHRSGHESAHALLYFKKIHPVVIELMHVDRRTDGRTDR